MVMQSICQLALPAIGEVYRINPSETRNSGSCLNLCHAQAVCNLSLLSKHILSALYFPAISATSKLMYAHKKRIRVFPSANVPFLRLGSVEITIMRPVASIGLRASVLNL